MNETIKRLLQENAKFIVSAIITFTLFVLSTYVASQLWQQDMTNQVNANTKDIAEIRDSLGDRPQKQQEFRVLQSQVATIIDNQKEQGQDIKDIKRYLLEHKQ